MQQDILEYRGRVPKRASSIQRRNDLLQAALELIRKEGVRGVRHRAVAELAQVPLSATTYYFSDIDQLIVDSFVYFMQQNLNQQQQAFAEIIGLVVDEGSKKLNKQQLVEQIKQILIQYIQQQVSEVESRIIERSFLQYATIEPSLAHKVNQIREYFEQNIAQILNLLGVRKPKEHALMVIASIQYLEDKAILTRQNKTPQVDKKQVTVVVDKLLSGLS
ncbi:TetR/AcrR family transcriptional regulator [Kangiella sp. TOML190]|uniref:TetR/AcrR family transcriptional regulator n=1 Tax=Kangiella sp. TOML190 TaxID=2931351 RepID=UPI0020414CB1|nr:hypothetical protein [Kangiella sp. TOML190]